jgi:drug/metabolite transporter (DMT)-like permease
MSNVKAQTVAIFSYIDPVVAIILSALILKEKMGIAEIIGAVLILGATLVCEINFKKKYNS